MNQTAPPSSALPSPSLHHAAERVTPSDRRVVKDEPSSLLFATKRQTRPVKDAIAGACAGAVAKTVVAPIERIKLLMQLQFSIDNKSRGGGARRCSAWAVTKQVYREQGILAFWRGEYYIINIVLSCGVDIIILYIIDDFLPGAFSQTLSLVILRQYTKRN